ncbi:MAG: ribosomal large subunit pseudouridine synthase [Candidatus Angelobacter sp.]|jgi:23S rRNA pseudouridine1911/1915/1917 synthase|nr:ribosomal large subunit pseudouridine synthase [Candidatus Angelobacter sp.]
MPAPASQTDFQATAEDAGKRLDQFVVSQLDDVSRARVQQLIEQEKVTVNGKPEKASYRVQDGDEIQLLGPAVPPPLKATPENIPLDVVYEDDSLAVINKPAGMMVHAGAGHTANDDDDEEGDPRTRGTLVNALLYRFNKLSQEGGELRPGIVHRLDKETSGLIIVAKSDSAHRKLAEQFSSRVVKKKYIALVHGWPKLPQGTINAAIGRDRSRRHRMSTRGREGRDAVTHYKVLEELTTPYGKFALLEVTIETGRTHQIRVHLASLGHAVVGDTLYGSPHEIAPLSSAYNRAQPADTKATRDRATSELTRMLTEQATGDGAQKASKQKSSKKKSKLKQAEPARKSIQPISLSRNFLHAAALQFVHPKSGKAISFERPLPSELDGFLAELRHLT